MKLIKKILGFDNPYSWVKWVRMTFAAIALIIAVLFGTEIFSFFEDFGIIGALFFLIVLAVIFAPTLAVCIGVSIGIAAIIGGVVSGKKQVRSLKESAASGSAEILHLDKTRIKVQVLRFLMGIIGAVLVITVFILLFTDGLTIDGEAAEFGAGWPIIIIGAILFIIFGLAYNRLKGQYDFSFKEQVVRKELESFLEDMEFYPNKTIDQSIVRDSRLFSGYDAYSGNDYISAAYKNKRFIQSDIHLQEEYTRTYTDSDGNTHTDEGYRTLFQGRFMVFDYDAISNEPVYVRDKRMKQSDGMIQTELDAFNKTFGITAKDAVTAFRILTPQVLEGIALASGKLKYPMSLAFLNDKIYVVIANGDAFEAVSVGDATLTEQRERVKREIQPILDMVETIYLK